MYPLPNPVPFKEQFRRSEAHMRVYNLLRLVTTKWWKKCKHSTTPNCRTKLQFMSVNACSVVQQFPQHYSFKDTLAWDFFTCAFLSKEPIWDTDLNTKSISPMYSILKLGPHIIKTQELFSQAKAIWDFIPWPILGPIAHPNSKFWSRFPFQTVKENNFIPNIRIHLGAFAEYSR